MSLAGVRRVWEEITPKKASAKKLSWCFCTCLQISIREANNKQLSITDYVDTRCQGAGPYESQWKSSTKQNKCHPVQSAQSSTFNKSVVESAPTDTNIYIFSSAKLCTRTKPKGYFSSSTPQSRSKFGIGCNPALVHEDNDLECKWTTKFEQRFTLKYDQ